MSAGPCSCALRGAGRRRAARDAHVVGRRDRRRPARRGARVRRRDGAGRTWSGRSSRGLTVVPADAVRRGDRLASALDRPDDPGARPARRDDRRAVATASSRALRLVAVGLAFAVYALLLDHDRLLAAAGWARRSTVAVALATRLVPAARARRTRPASRAARSSGRARARSASSRRCWPARSSAGLNLAEAMEARGYGRAERTRAPRPPWTTLDRLGARRSGRGDRGGCAVALATIDGLRLRVRRAASPVLDGRVAADRGRASTSRCSGRPAPGSRRSCARSPALVPHFHGGVFSGSVVVGGLDTRETRPAQLAGIVASVFQDPEDQTVMSPGRERGGVRAREHRRRPRARSGRVSRRRLRWSARSTSQTARPPSCRAASCSGSRSRRRLRCGRGCSCSTSRPRSSTRTRRKRSSTWSSSFHARCSSPSSAPHGRSRTVDRVLFMDGGRIVLDAPRARGPRVARGAPARSTSACAGARRARARRAVLLRRARSARACLARGAARRDRRARGAERRRQDDARADRGRAARAGLRRGDAGTARLTSPRIRAGISSPSACSTRSRSAPTSSAPVRRSTSSASASTSSATRATCRPASGSGFRSPPCSRPSRTCSCSTSRRAASIPNARSSSPDCCGVEAGRRGTLVVTHDLPWAAEVADRVVELPVREGVRA